MGSLSKLGGGNMRKYKKKLIYEILEHLVLIFASVLFLIPFFWMLSTSLKTDTQLFVYPPIWMPDPINWVNYVEATKYIPFFRYFGNTAIVTFISTLGVILSCPLAAYSLSKMRWSGRDAVFSITLAVMMIPGQVTMIPLYVLFNKVGFVNSYVPLIIQSFFGVPFYIFLIRQFFMGIPDSLLDSAKIDGASELRKYVQIVMPLAKPAILSVGLFQFMSSWTDFMGPLLYLNKPSMYTLSLGLQQFQSEFGTEWGLMMAASTMMTIPVIILYFLLQKTFIQGVTFTGIKG